MIKNCSKCKQAALQQSTGYRDCFSQILLFDIGPVVARLGLEDLLELLDRLLLGTKGSLLELSLIADATPACEQQHHILTGLVYDLRADGNRRENVRQ